MENENSKTTYENTYRLEENTDEKFRSKLVQETTKQVFKIKSTSLQNTFYKIILLNKFFKHNNLMKLKTTEKILTYNYQLFS